MQPLATDVRVLRRLYIDGTEDGEPGDAVARYTEGKVFRCAFFPSAKTATQEETGISVSESRMVVKVPWTRCFRPGDRLADEDGRALWEVVSETTYPGHQRLEVRPI